VFTFVTGCNCNEDKSFGICDQIVIISAEGYSTAPFDTLHINNISEEKDCLKINFSASGCSGNSWAVKIIDSEEIMESYPPQRNIRFSFKNEEMCEAYNH
jgi:hypothetical protein